MGEAHLLVVEDDLMILELLAGSLRFAGFSVSTAATAAEATASARTRPPDLVVLDVMLPDQDGFTVLRRLRAQGSHVPVVFLTARDAVQDRISGLTLGGDDYICKPFSLDEVIARIRAVLRRLGRATTSAPRLAVADLVLDDDSHEVSRAGQPISLSPNEYRLLRYLMENAGRVLSRAQILDHVWEYDYRGEGNVVESYVCYLRRKIDVAEPKLLRTVRGVGYVLRVPP
jgi:two-component system OmpR family response regulator